MTPMAWTPSTPTVVDVRVNRGAEMADSPASSFYESVGGLHE